MVDYLSIQIAVAILTCIAGVFAYTLFRYYWKDQSIQNLNDFLKTLDIDLIIEKLQFNSKFWKTAAVAMAASVVIVALVYGEIVGQIIPDEHILVTASKFFAIGVGMNFTINSLASGGQVSKLIQAILVAFTQTNEPQSVKLQKAKQALEAQHLVVRIADNPAAEHGGNDNSDKVDNDPETENTK